MLTITQVQTAEQLQQTKTLIDELSAWDMQQSKALGLDVDALMGFLYNDLAHELATAYAPPMGRMLLVSYEGQPGGCGAIHPFSPGIAEIKRLYVRPTFRGKGMGKALMEALIAEARQIGYASLRLETAPFMKDAHKLYYALGFQDIAPYVDLPDVLKPIEIFMELKLS